jgi:hypothetical protein
MENNILYSFFSKDFENYINEKMMYRNYVVEEEKILNYVKQLISIPQSEFVTFFVENYDVSYLTYNNIFQFSNFQDGTVNICKKIKQMGNDGYKSIEIGAFLLDDGIERKPGALRKYGENHAKLATELCLLNEISNTFFLTCLGYVFCELDEQTKKQLLFRLILRTKFFRRLLYRVETNGYADYYEEASLLSEATKKRRRSNVKTMLDFLKENADDSTLVLLNKITV